MRKHDPQITSENKSLYRKLVRVALPIALQSLLSSSLSLVDNLLVGHLGETEIAAVALSVQIHFIFWMILFGFCSGTITYMSQFWGKRDLTNIRRVAGIGITVSFSLGVLFFIVALVFPDFVLGIFTPIQEIKDMGRNFVRLGAPIFLFWSITVPLTAALKSTQQTALPLKISIVALSLNTALACVLIYGFFGMPKLGILGAALATSISRCIEMILYIYVIFGRKNIVAGPLREFFSWNADLFKRILRNSIPTTLNELFWSTGSSAYSAAFGRVSIMAVAAYQAGNTIMNLFALFCFAIGDAMLILVGEQFGKGELEKGINYARGILKIVIPLGLIAGLLMLGSSGFIIGLFDGLTPDGVHATRLILLVFAGVLWLKLFNVSLIAGTLRAGGDTTYAAGAEIASVWLLGVPAAFFCALVLKFPVYLVVLCIQIEEVVKGIFLYYRYRSKRWVRNLVDMIEDD